MPEWSGPGFWRLYPLVPREIVAHPSQLGLAMVYAVLSEVSSHCAFGGMPACREDGGKPHLHKSSTGSSGTCPSTDDLSNNFGCRGTFAWKGCQM